MKLTFEGTYAEILNDIKDFLGVNASRMAPPATDATVSGPEAQAGAQPKAAAPAALGKTAGKTTGKPTTAAAAKKPAAPPPDDLADEELDIEDPTAEEAAMTPAEMAALRSRTLTELQTAYANGQQAEVFAILKKYGDGAKSFRELSMDAFPAIRKAIDNGALASSN